MLTESGLAELSTLTSSEIVTATAERFGPAPAKHAAFLGAAADAVIYSSRAVVGPAEADAAWTAQRTLRRLVRRRLSVRARLAASLRYHRTKPARPLSGPLSWGGPQPAAKRRARRPRRTGSHRGR